MVLGAVPRLADFAVWARAGEVVLGLETREFIATRHSTRNVYLMGAEDGPQRQSPFLLNGGMAMSEMRAAAVPT